MNKTLRESIYEELKRRILSQEYNANELVSEKVIAGQFNVSKTPVREALNQLCQEGFVTRYPSFGYIIKELSYQDVKDICELRYILETAAVRLVIRYASDEEIRGLYDYIDPPKDSVREGHGKNTLFHWELSKLTKNLYLTNDILRLAMSSARPSTFFGAGDGGTDEEYHGKIVDALLKRNIEEAERYLKLDILPGGHRDI